MENFKKKKLRIGILTNGSLVPAWFYSVLEKINNSSYAEIVLVVEKIPVQTNKASTLSRAFKNRRYLAYMLYRKLENKIFKPAPFAFSKKDIKQLIGQVPVLKISPIEKKFSDTISATDIEKIKQYNIDVFIQNGFRILRGDILKTAAHGVWSFHHGDNRINRGSPAGVWESIEGWREMGCVLQILTEDLDNGKILYRSWSQRDVISINRTLNAVYWKAVSFIPRKLEELYEVGPESFEKKVNQQNEKPSLYSSRLYKAPSNGQFIARILNRYFKLLKLKLWLLFNFEQWILLYCFNEEEKIAASMFRYKRITPPKDRFWADPCVIYKNERYYIFLEEAIYGNKKNSGKGHISVIEMDTKGNYTKPEMILTRDYHLSYPFVFEYRNEFYMIPESLDNATIELYKCTSFPNKWEFVMNLLENIRAVDTTIFEKDGKLWMFTNIKENEGASNNDELFLFYADELLTTQWKPHPKNPIVSDVKSARPAGPLFFQDNKLYRPSQDCSYRYGYATVINEVIELNTNEYVEKAVSSILPNWSKDLVGTHTLTHQKNLTVIDAWTKRRK